MTMPHLMNCQHMGDGWCLDCVKRLHDEKEAVIQAWVKDQEFRNSQREELLDMMDRWRREESSMARERSEKAHARQTQ